MAVCLHVKLLSAYQLINIKKIKPKFYYSIPNSNSKEEFVVRQNNLILYTCLVGSKNSKGPVKVRMLGNVYVHVHLLLLKPRLDRLRY